MTEELFPFIDANNRTLAHLADAARRGVGGGRMAVDTPQRRRRIQQLVANAFRGCSAEFVNAGRGALAFRVRGPTGRVRSGILRLPAHHERTRLNAAWLHQQFQRAMARKHN